MKLRPLPPRRHQSRRAFAVISGPVVHPYELGGGSALADDLVEHADGVVGVDRAGDPDRQGLAGVLVDDVEQLQRAAVDGGVELEVQRPDVIGPLRTESLRRHGRVAEPEPLPLALRYPQVAVTDDDCVPAADWLAVIENRFSAERELGALTCPVFPLPADDADLVPVSTRTSPLVRTFSGRHVPWEVGSGNNFAVRREWLEIVRGNDERLGPGASGQGGVDMDLFYRLLRSGARIRYDPACLVQHAKATKEERLARRAPYGHGIGADVAIWLREGDLFALWVLARWLAMRLRRLGAGVRRRDRTLAYEEALVLGGTARGLLFGLRAGRERPTSYGRPPPPTE